MIKKNLIFYLTFLIGNLFLFFPAFVSAQLNYHLTYKDSSSSFIKISIQPSVPLTGALSFVMPRSVPGGYDISIYDKFVENINVIAGDGKKYPMIKDINDAPRWYFNDTGRQILRIEYEINLDKMERRLAAGHTSIIRPGFAGILNYSVFGWIDGTEQQPVVITAETFANWAIF